MKTIVYDKLIRDRIPEIIEASGKTCVTEILSNEDYLKMLDKKLDEELEQMRAEKAAKCGGFEKKVLLKQAEEA